MFILLILFVELSDSYQCDYYNETYNENMILLQGGSVGITIFQAETDYHIYVMEGENYAIYSVPIEQDFRFSYDKGFMVNNKDANLVEGEEGNITLTPLLEKFLGPIKGCEIEPFRICYDFSTERLSLKIVVGVLLLLVVISNGRSIGTTFEKVGNDLLRSKFARGLSWTGSPLESSKDSYSKIEKETGV